MPLPLLDPTPGPSIAYLVLSSGEQVEIIYQWTFGAMAIVAALLVLIVLFAGRWLYDLFYQLWTWRGR